MTAWNDALDVKYRDAMDFLERAVKACPDEMWVASMWTVRDIVALPAGMGAELPPDERLQIFSAVWNIAYHAIYILDFYLSRAELPFECPPPFDTDDLGFSDPVTKTDRRLPSRMYSREELLGYLDHCRRKATDVIGALTEDEAASPAKNRPFARLLLQNLVHIWEHATQIQMFVDTHPTT